MFYNLSLISYEPCLNQAMFKFKLGDGIEVKSKAAPVWDKATVTWVEADPEEKPIYVTLRGNSGSNSFSNEIGWLLKYQNINDETDVITEEAYQALPYADRAKYFPILESEGIKLSGAYKAAKLGVLESSAASEEATTNVVIGDITTYQGIFVVDSFQFCDAQGNVYAPTDFVDASVIAGLTAILHKQWFIRQACNPIKITNMSDLSELLANVSDAQKDLDELLEDDTKVAE